MNARVASAIAVSVLVACGGSDPPAPDPITTPSTDLTGEFVGKWDGTVSMVVSGTLATPEPFAFHVFRTGVNTLSVHNFCTADTGPTATVNSATRMTMAGLSCPPEAVTGCAAVTLTLAAGGAGTLAGGQLTMAMSGSMTGCGQSFPYTITFTGTRTSTDPTTPRMGTTADADGTVVIPHGPRHGALAILWASRL